MITFTSLEEDALTILAFYKQGHLRDGGSLRYADLYNDARSAGINLQGFRAAMKWLTSNRYLDLPSDNVDAYVLTRAGWAKMG